MSASMTLADLATMPRWVAWQTERTPEGRVTKVPYSPRAGRAKSDDPTSWGTRQAAHARAAGLPKPHGAGGDGFELGDLGNGQALGGLDLDTCRDPGTGALEPWAADLVQRLGSYAEVSPSGTGAKVFFTYTPADLPRLLDVMGSKGGRKWARGKGEHAPAIELYLQGRYFAVTDDRLPDAPADIRPVPTATLERLIRHDGPGFARGDVLTRAAALPAVARLLRGDTGHLADTSRSGLTMALGSALKRAGWSFEDVADALRTWPETAEWCAEKGDANGGRELRRLWDRAALAEARPDARDEFTAVAPARTLRLLKPSDCAAAAGRDYVAKGLLSAGDVACLLGAPGAGKSVLAPHLAYAVAQGRPVFGRRTKPGRVFYVAAEDPHGMRQRVHALRLGQGDADGFALVEGVGNLLDPAEGDQLRALIAEHRPALVVLDTQAAAFPGLDENASADMSRIVSYARSLTAQGAAVVLVHHDTKAGDATPRGHSVLNGALDVAVHLTKPDDGGVIRARLTKNRNGPCDLDIAFRISAVVIGGDTDGDTVTAPVATEVRGTAPRADRLPRGAGAALEVLRDMAGGGAVPEAVWRQECDATRRVSTAEDRESRSKAFRRAYGELVDRGLIRVADGAVSLPRGGDEFATIPPGQTGQDPDMSGLSGRQTGAGTRTDRTGPFRACPLSGSAMPDPDMESLLQ